MQKTDINKVLSVFKPVPAIAAAVALMIFIVKILDYPRILGHLLYLLREAVSSFNTAFLVIAVIFIIIAVLLLLKKNWAVSTISLILTFGIFFGLAYYINRVVFQELYENKVLVANIKVRMVYTNPLTLFLNFLLIAGAVAAFIVIKKLLNKFLKSIETRLEKHGNKNILVKRPVIISCLAAFILLNFIVFLLRFIILPPAGKYDKQPEAKVVILGIDGADWNIINPLVKKGRLTTIEKLMKNGVSADLLSPPAHVKSGPSWSSIATGLTVAKHGITTNYGYVKQQRIWNIFNHFNYKTDVINWICSPHVEKMDNGFFISGPYDDPVSYPEGLLALLTKKFGPYYPDVDSREISDKFVKSCFDVTKNRTKVVNYLIDGLMPDFLAITYTSSDRLQHFIWQYYEPNKFEYPINSIELEKYKKSIDHYYIKLDRQLAGIIAKFDPAKTTFVVLSDHGFEALPKKKIYSGDVEINYILQKLGLFKMNRDMSIDRSGLYAEEKSNFGDLKRTVEVSMPGSIRDLMPMFESCTIKQDGKKLFHNIRVEDNKIKMQLDTALYNLNSTEMEFIYKGQRYSFPLEDFINRNKLRSGDHRREGMIILSGPNIKKGIHIPAMKVYDVLPTILVSQNLPIAFDIDGIPVTEIFEKPVDVSYIRTYETFKKQILRAGKKTESTDERLRSLGYLN